MISFEVSGDQALALRFEKFPEKLRGLFVERITAITEELYGRIVAKVPRRSGRLSTQIHEAIRQGKNFVKGSVFVQASGKDAAKAAALEYGSHSVKTHPMRLDHVFQRFIAPTTVTVKAHRREIAAADYLHGPFEAFKSEALAQLRAATDEAAQSP